MIGFVVRVKHAHILKNKDLRPSKLQSSLISALCHNGVKWICASLLCHTTTLWLKLSTSKVCQLSQCQFRLVFFASITIASFFFLFNLVDHGPLSLLFGKKHSALDPSPLALIQCHLSGNRNMTYLRVENWPTGLGGCKLAYTFSGGSKLAYKNLKLAYTNLFLGQIQVCWLKIGLQKLEVGLQKCSETINQHRHHQFIDPWHFQWVYCGNTYYDQD